MLYLLKRSNASTWITSCPVTLLNNSIMFDILVQWSFLRFFERQVKKKKKPKPKTEKLKIQKRNMRINIGKYQKYVNPVRPEWVLVTTKYFSKCEVNQTGTFQLSSSPYHTIPCFKSLFSISRDVRCFSIKEVQISYGTTCILPCFKEKSC